MVIVERVDLTRRTVFAAVERFGEDFEEGRKVKGEEEGFASRRKLNASDSLKLYNEEGRER